MYWVKGLTFQEATLTAMERRYGITIERVPHFDLAAVLSNDELRHIRPDSPQFRTITMRQMHDSWRRRTGFAWIATGEKKSDSFTRLFMMKKAGMWNAHRGVYCPLMSWTDRQVFAYLRLRHIPLPPEYRHGMTASFGGFSGPLLKIVKRNFPADYRKILEVFPHCEALVKSYELFREGRIQLPRKKTARTHEAPALHDAASESRDARGRPVQSPADR
jgi:3'-phosphoadenosine 5'-phosphosulfate sulfotransferase (PAPS reductase)/FAD synthetase